MDESTQNWSPNKDRGRQRGVSEDDEDKDFMHALTHSLFTAGSRTHSAHPTGKPKEAQHPKHAAPTWEAQTWQTLQC